MAPPASLVPVSDLRPLAGAEPSRPDDLARLAESVKAHGVLEPLLVRPAGNDHVVRYGRLKGRFGYLVIDTRRLVGSGYAGGELPPIFPTPEEARAAVPPDVPYEVVRGLGRLAAARLCHLRQVPVVVADLTEAEAREMRAFG